MCFGFLGIQMGFALQNANVSRIFQTLGAAVDQIPIFWVAAPLTSLIIQPAIGYMSDRSWSRFGRRRPYFFVGAVIASLALVIMPNSSYLWFAVGMLWIMDASITASMEPARAFVGDMLSERQRTIGFAMQTFFIGVGAIVASALPWIMTNWLDVSNTAPAGQIPESVKISFYVGGAAFLLAVSWTALRTREYSPEQLAHFEAARDKSGESRTGNLRAASKYRSGGILWLAVGVALLLLIRILGFDKELYAIGGGLTVFGIFQIIASLLQDRGNTSNGFYEIMHDLFHMPRVMRQLAIVQFFSWFAMFAMWIFGTSAVASYHFGASDVTSAAYNDGADWNGVLFASYNLYAAFAAMAIPFLASRLGYRISHLVNLSLGGLGLISFYFVKDPMLLLASMVGVGIAWASMLSLPYALLANNLPAGKMGGYIGIFNFFIVIPQLVAASILGVVLRELFGLQPIFGLVVGGVSLLIAGIATLLVDKSAEPRP